MIHLIYGGSGSGKSEYAESCVLSCSEPDNRYYIATMQAFGEEGQKRVERHRTLRAGKGFKTIECQRDILTAADQIENIERSTILIECISNLVANEMFDSEQKETELAERVVKALTKLCTQAENAILVTNNIFDDGMEYDEVTLRYAQYLGKINMHIAKLADKVTEVVAGIPIY